MSDFDVFVEGLSPDVRSQFDEFHRLLVEWNERMNLTGITEYDEVYLKHFYDSVLLANVPEAEPLLRTSGIHILDMGTGAGFPGLPLAILYPQVKFTLCDSLQKRLTFIDAVADSLGLKNVRTVHGRAEDLARDKNHREKYDMVVSRAVAKLNVLCEITVPFVRVGGFLFSYKGPNVVDEVSDGRRAAHQLGAEIGSVYPFHLPRDAGERNIVVFKKTAKTNSTFPRKAGTPQKRPL